MDDFITSFNERRAEKGRAAGELTEWERAVLDALPRFEDGDPVRIGDEFLDDSGEAQTVFAVTLWPHGGDLAADLVDLYGWGTTFAAGEAVLRPRVDANGVPLLVGSAVRYRGGEWLVACDVDEYAPGCVLLRRGRVMAYAEPSRLEVVPVDDRGQAEPGGDAR